MFKLIYKNCNESSFQAIKKFQKNNNIKKIGHTGTLDPLAKGLLLVAIDEYTKLIPFIKNKNKEYYVKFKLGFISKTYDKEGPISFFSDFYPSTENVLKTINNFIGNIKQIPPDFSAKKINGIPAYKLARKKEKINLKPTNITICSIHDIKYKYPYGEFKVVVSNGTYIRSLIHDIGKTLNTGAYVTYLERIMVNGIKQNDEIDINKLLDSTELNVNKNDLKKLLHGTDLNYSNYKNGNYLLKNKNEIIGFVCIKNKTKIKQKIFVGKILKLLNLNN